MPQLIRDAERWKKDDPVLPTIVRSFQCSSCFNQPASIEIESGVGRQRDTGRLIQLGKATKSSSLAKHDLTVYYCSVMIWSVQLRSGPQSTERSHSAQRRPLPLPSLRHDHPVPADLQTVSSFP